MVDHLKRSDMFRRMLREDVQPEEPREPQPVVTPISHIPFGFPQKREDRDD